MCNLAKREDFFIEKVRQKMKKYEKQTKNLKMKHMNSAKYTKWLKMHIMCTVMQTILLNRML